jgi:hypothetical protein
MSVSVTQKFQLFLRQQLDDFSPAIAAEIGTIISDLDDITDICLDITIHSDQLDQQLPITASLYRNFSILKTWELASSIKTVLSQEQLAVLSKYDQAGVEITEITLQTLIEWFADCWQRVTHDRKQITAQISIHDDIEVFDLNLSEWREKKTQF